MGCCQSRAKFENYQDRKFVHQQRPLERPSRITREYKSSEKFEIQNDLKIAVANGDITNALRLLKKSLPQIITQNFLILDVISKNSDCSITFVAKDRESGVKIIIKQINLPENYNQNHIQQIEKLKHIEHPNIVRFVDCLEIDKSYYLVSNYEKTVSLKEKLIESHYISERLACSYVHDILKALDICQKHDIVHRNLKPTNLIFENASYDSKIIIKDFCVSWEIQDMIGNNQPV